MVSLTRPLLTISQKLGRGIHRLKLRLTAKQWPQNSIVYFCPPVTPDPWYPQRLKSGLGGSETAVIYLSQIWVKAGYQVSVYNNCGDHAGTYEGVTYIDYRQFNPWDYFETLVVWRLPWRMRFPNHSKRVWLDVHETLVPAERTASALAGYDLILLKSAYHRSLFDQVSDSRIKVIPNGVEASCTALFTEPKAPYDLIYASNYSRGLEEMLEFGWPIIAAEVPEARLYIYYGWSLPQTLTPEQQAWQAKMQSLMQQPGIIDQGRIGQRQLLEAKARATIHYYGCTFLEVDCISVRESAMVGCVPVTTAYAALAEKPYCLTVSGSIRAAATHEKLAQRIVQLLKQPEQLDELRQQFFAAAKHETWDIVARQWLDLVQ